ncbi:Asp-tRNA(Asn)/Glu-tRNA(Gln) amidotransferase subunit GatA [Deinococcus peraridilitoris]|uniref:Glutamyl-tRNA(Gln) amidotransferase subunit A n=1 Tax=Deinococcus peraridilitoris (strain DSM 19664 / LMG 22246 / CIP 109416 / KR-200) TaxID=937777 RepID=L0A722_DEIPD|nr:Asp-tRNA(Asn)/Glu-tRNA(Gln) amidotransferase subunit GatA [Deinococcus peraridilitoris]AFZ68855.1 glutamyl-tRNA(Gln) and/or aspartyl-tRNA(Asn) amidotransferase, A subunit [Deinococcus peraridilitoris DSM 19664]
MSASASQLAQLVLQGQRQPSDLVEEAFQQISLQAHLGALISTVEGAPEQAQLVAKRLRAGVSLPLAGVPVVVKDNLNVKGTRTTCGSRALENYHSPYTATAVQRLIEAGAVVVGKANMDEFAMGSSSENSAFGVVRNPWDHTRVPGGSSGGSAVAVAAGMVPVALGSDTGGSVRQPAAFNGVYGFKPTYGRVSRYGLVAYASSLDQIGPFARSAEDLALLMDVISGPDARDATSLETLPAFRAALTREVRGMKFGLVREALEGGNTPGVRAAVEQICTLLESLGASVAEVGLPTLHYGVAAYYLIATPEASSNLARYDGMVYSHRAAGQTDVNSSMSSSRGAAFGPEVKRRILMGTYALSSGYYDAFYAKAMKVRRLVADDFARAFGHFDALITPTSPFPAFRLGEKTHDPLSMYAADIDTVMVNLAGVPALSIPAGYETLEGRELPVGVQFIAPALGDERLVTIAKAIEDATNKAYLRLAPQN